MSQIKTRLDLSPPLISRIQGSTVIKNSQRPTVLSFPHTAVSRGSIQRNNPARGIIRGGKGHVPPGKNSLDFNVVKVLKIGLCPSLENWVLVDWSRFWTRPSEVGRRACLKLRFDGRLSVANFV